METQPAAKSEPTVRDSRGRFIAGHAPLPGAGRPYGSHSGPLIDALKQALKNETLQLAATPPVAALLQRRRRATERKRRYRARRRDGTYCALIRFAPTMIADLVELGLLPDDQRCGRHEFEVAVSTAIDTLRQASRPR